MKWFFPSPTTRFSSLDNHQGCIRRFRWCKYDSHFPFPSVWNKKDFWWITFTCFWFYNLLTSWWLYLRNNHHLIHHEEWKGAKTNMMGKKKLKPNNVTRFWIQRHRHITIETKLIQSISLIIGKTRFWPALRKRGFYGLYTKLDMI